MPRRSAPEVADERLRDALDQSTMEALRPTTAVVAGLYLLICVGTIRFAHLAPDPRTPWIMGAVTFVGGAAAVALWIYLGRKGLPPARAPKLLTVVLALTSVTTGLRLHLTGDPGLSAGFVVLALTAGSVLMSRRWLLVALAWLLGMWLLIAAQRPTDVLWVRWGFGVLAAAGTGGVIHVARVRRIARELADNLQLKAALAETEAAREAVSLARDAAERANRLKSEFLAHISHEIRTPMNAILGMNRLMLDTELTDEQREYCETVQSSGEILLTLLNDVLDISKIEAGKLEISSSRVDLAALVAQVVEMFRAPAAQKGIAVAATVDPTLPEDTLGDPGRLRQVLVNLVGNAVKFTEQGRVTVGVDVLERDDAVALLRVAIEDTGIGIRPDRIEHLFEPFVQAESSMSRRFGGTGLGLAICRRLIELMGGEITMTSEVGVGTRCEVLVPLRRGVVVKPAPAPEATAPGPPPPAPAPDQWVLVAEDNRVNQRLIEVVLRKLGYRSIIVADGDAAVGALRERSVAAVLMDIEMPRVDGYEATARIRALEAASERRTPIIAMTANVMDGERERCLQAGMDAYLSKPLRFEALAEALARFCG